MKAVSGAVDQKLKDANAYADATRDDFEKVLPITRSIQKFNKITNKSNFFTENS